MNLGRCSPPGVMSKFMNMRQICRAIGICLFSLVISGCASGAILNSIRSEGIGILNPFGLVVGLGVVW